MWFLLLLSQRVAIEFEAIGIVDETVEDGVGEVLRPRPDSNDGRPLRGTSELSVMTVSRKKIHRNILTRRRKRERKRLEDAFISANDQPELRVDEWAKNLRDVNRNLENEIAKH